MLSIRIAASFHNSYFLFRFISDSVKQAPIGQKKRQPCQQAACSLHDKILRLSMHVLRMHKILLYHCTGIQVTCQYQSRRNVDTEWSQCGRIEYQIELLSYQNIARDIIQALYQKWSEGKRKIKEFVFATPPSCQAIRIF